MKKNFFVKVVSARPYYGANILYFKHLEPVQLASSLLSRQSFCPSHTQAGWMQGEVCAQRCGVRSSPGGGARPPSALGPEQGPRPQPLSSDASGQSALRSHTRVAVMHWPVPQLKRHKVLFKIFIFFFLESYELPDNIWKKFYYHHNTRKCSFCHDVHT